MRFWEIVAFQSQCLYIDKKISSSFLLQNQKNCRCSSEAESLGQCQNFKNIWTFWISLFLLVQHLLMMYSGFCRYTPFQAWSSGLCWIRLCGRIWVTVSSNLIFLPTLLMNSCSISLAPSRKYNSLSNVEQYVSQSRKTSVVLLLFSRRDLPSLLQKWCYNTTYIFLPIMHLNENKTW